MAKRPWATAEDIVAYTEIQAVKERSPAKLEIDISRAEAYVINYTRNNFEDDSYPELPNSVKNATVLLAEFYSHKAIKSEDRFFKSESIGGNYSYTLADNESGIAALDLAPLLDAYYIPESDQDIELRIIKL